MLEQFLHEVHHPVVVLVGHVQLEHGEFRVVEAAESFVPEVLTDFVDALVAPHDQPLQVQLVGNAQVELHVERVVVRDERPGRSAPVHRLQNGRFDLQIAPFVQEPSDRRNHARPLAENLPHLGIDDQIGVPLPVAKFLVRHLVVDLPVLLFDDGQRTERFGQQLQPPGVDGDLAHARAEHEALHAHDVANVQQLLEDLIVKAFGQVLTPDVHLDAAGLVLQIEKGGLPHDAPRHDAAGNRHLVGFGRRPVLPRLVPFIVKVLQDLGRMGRNLPAIGVRIDPHRFELLARPAPFQFLFGQYALHGLRSDGLTFGKTKQKTQPDELRPFCRKTG